MDLRIKKLNSLQNAAVDAWVSAEGNGTVLSSQRTGKTIISFKCIYKALELGWLKLGDKIRYRAEVRNRKKVIFEEERQACISILGKDPFKDFEISFMTYQAGAGEFVNMEIFDEIDCVLSSINHLVIKNSPAKLKLGLTGTLQAEATVFRDQIDSELHGMIRQKDEATKKKKIDKFINKGQLMEVLLPICFEYPMWQAIIDGLISPFETIILSHSLGTKDKYLQLYKNYPALYNEWDYYIKNVTVSREWHKPIFLRQNASRKNTNLLYYNMRSKQIVTKKLLEHLDQTILFSVGKKLFEGVTDNVCTPSNVTDLIEQFRNKEIDTIASSKMISRGTSIPNLDAAVFMSYYSKSADFLQKLARICTYKEGKTSKMFIIVTEGTYEERWFKGLCEVKDDKGKLKHKIDLNVKKIISTRDLFRKGFKL